MVIVIPIIARFHAAPELCFTISQSASGTRIVTTVNWLRRNRADYLAEEGEIGFIIGHQKGDANNQDGEDGPRYHSQNRDKMGLRLELPPMSGERATTIKQTFRVCNIGALTGSDY
jgi:hypothetical protein